MKTKMSIILVDDDPDDRMLFSDAFSELDSGGSLQLFDNGRQALDYLREAEALPDIIFLDLNMGIIGGLETLLEIRKNERYSKLSVVIYSTSSAEKDIEDTLVAGANIYITKPSDFNRLKEALARVIKTNFQFLTEGLDRDTFVLVT